MQVQVLRRRQLATAKTPCDMYPTWRRYPDCSASTGAKQAGRAFSRAGTGRSSIFMVVVLPQTIRTKENRKSRPGDGEADIVHR